MADIGPCAAVDMQVEPDPGTMSGDPLHVRQFLHEDHRAEIARPGDPRSDIPAGRGDPQVRWRQGGAVRHWATTARASFAEYHAAIGDQVLAFAPQEGEKA